MRLYFAMRTLICRSQNIFSGGIITLTESPEREQCVAETPFVFAVANATDHVRRQEWQIAEIEAGLAEADRGEFASDQELAAVFAKYIAL